ncbi:MAG: hypothetical protein HY046_08600 [Acidobacteria bacterium]|nr:hypothetical protein [Acidobacteriota bacterium]
MRRAAFILIFLTALSVQAQNDSRPSIVLPQKLVAGQSATLAVLDRVGKLKSGAVVEFEGGLRVTTDSTGRARFTAPDQAGILIAELSGGEGNARLTRATAQVVSAAATESEGIRVTDVARTISVRDRFTVTGDGFLGDADTNHVTLNGQMAAVLAASPISLVIAGNPSASTGSAQLVVEVSGKSSAAVTVTLVALEMTAPAEKLKPGKKLNIEIRLRGTELPMEIRIQNLSPDVAELNGGDTRRMMTSGGADNLARVEIQGRREGEFSLSVRLVPTAAGMPDTAAARRELQAASKSAPGAWSELIDKLVRHLDEHPEHALDVRNELEKLLAKTPPGEYGRHLEAAWQILLKP